MIKSRGEKQNGRNPFDLSNRHVYTSKVAKITPVKAFHCHPDDYLEVDMSEFSQNINPMNTAAFLSGKKELLAYFVPYNSVWHNFNQYQATREDPDSTLLKEKGISFEPRMSLYDMYKAAIHFATVKWLFTDYLQLLAVILYIQDNPYQETTSNYHNISELINYLKSKQQNRSPKLTLWDLWLKKAYDYAVVYQFPTSSGGMPLYDSDFNFFVGQRSNPYTYYETGVNMHDNFIWCDWVQKMDMLGYGNIYPLVHDYLTELNQHLDDILYNFDSSFSGTDVLVQIDMLSPNKTNISHIFNFFDSEQVQPRNAFFHDIPDRYIYKLRDICTYVDDNGLTQYEFVNVYAIYAYNKCFYDYMRNVYYDVDYSVYNYNCDFINGNTLYGSIIGNIYIPLRWYHLETHQWKKDMFTGCLPDNQLGQVSSVLLSGNLGDASFDDSVTRIYNSGSDTVTPGYLNQQSSNLYSVSGTSQGSVRIVNSHTHSLSDASFDVLALKRAEAIQQYRQDLMRAGNRTKDIFNQIYGTTPKSELDECPYFIEVASNDVNVNPIIATAETGMEANGKLGDIAARSTINGSPLHFKFSTKDFGVIIFLSYIVPDSFYNSTRLDPFVTHLDQEAHGLPYFQNLGLQPIIGEFLSNLAPASSRHSIRGYVPPYIERKSDIDLVHGNLVDTFIPRVGDIDVDVDFQGSLSHWVVARTDMQQEETTTLRQFYINPRIVDSVFAVAAGDDYESDHYLTYSKIDIKAVRPFSEIGLPRF